VAVERLKNCDNIVALARELGVHRRLLYKWRDQLDPVEVSEQSPPQNSRESTPRKDVSQLKRLVAASTGSPMAGRVVLISDLIWEENRRKRTTGDCVTHAFCR